MNALTAATPEGCRALAAECGKRADQYERTGDYTNCRKQIERARELVLLALKLEGGHR